MSGAPPTRAGPWPGPGGREPGDTHVQGLHVPVELRFPELGQLGENGVARHLAAERGVQPLGEHVPGFFQQRLRGGRRPSAHEHRGDRVTSGEPTHAGQRGTSTALTHAAAASRSRRRAHTAQH